MNLCASSFQYQGEEKVLKPYPPYLVEQVIQKIFPENTPELQHSLNTDEKWWFFYHAGQLTPGRDISLCIIYREKDEFANGTFISQKNNTGVFKGIAFNTESLTDYSEHLCELNGESIRNAFYRGWEIPIPDVGGHS